MNSLNSILLEGNLTRNPVLKETPKGTPVCEFAVASNRFYKQDDELQKEVSFFDIETWSKVAERCGDELVKGRGVRVVGRLKQNRWVATDGSNRSRIIVVAEHVEFKPQFNKPKTENDELLEENDSSHIAENSEVTPEEVAAVV